MVFTADILTVAVIVMSLGLNFLKGEIREIKIKKRVSIIVLLYYIILHFIFILGMHNDIGKFYSLV